MRSMTATGAPGPDPLFAFLVFEVKLLEVLGVSPETVKSDWRTARAWLRTRLAPQT